MLKCAGVYTCEIDDHKSAFDDIKRQLDEKITLMENTIGIIMCHTEFITSGFYKYLCENLPFELAGVTTASQAVNETADEMMLTIFVITSDDCRFEAGMTKSIETDVNEPVKSAYDKIEKNKDNKDKAVNKDNEKLPGLCLIFPPHLREHGGDSYVSAWERVIPGVPLFGARPTDDTVTFDECVTLYNGKIAESSMAFVLCYGNINPRFLIATRPETDATPHKGEVTKSEGSIVAEVNNISIYKYFEEFGLVKDGDPDNKFLFMPIMIDHKNRSDYDAVPVLSGISYFIDKYSAQFFCNVEVDSTLTLMNCRHEGMFASSFETFEKISGIPDVNGVLIFSCIVRRMMYLQSDSMIELQSAKEKIGGIPFMMGYAGGEICPTSVKNGIAANRFHNYTLIALIL
jgi:hypothetical protein